MAATFYVSLVYSIPSIFLYFFTIFIILANRKLFGSSFFTLYIFDGAMNIYTWLNGFYMLRLSAETCDTCIFAFLYRSTGDYFPMIILYAMSFHMAYVQYATTALISFNRLSVLWNFRLMEPIWKRYSWLACLVVFIVPFLDTHRNFYYHTDLVYRNETQSYKFETPMPITVNFEYLLPIMTVITIISVAVNIASLVMVRSLKSIKKDEVEFNLIIFMAITCMVQLLGCSLSVIRVIWATHPIARLLLTIVPFVSDGLTLVQPWLLIFISKMVRTSIKEMFRRNESATSSIMVRTFNGNKTR